MRKWLRTAGRPMLLVALATLGTGCQELPKLPPIAAFVYTPVSPIRAGSTSVVFNAAQSSAAQGRLAQFVWDFGDGSAATSSADPVTSHVFPPRGCSDFVYTVLLTVVDDSGLSSSSAQTVTVLPPLEGCGS